MKTPWDATSDGIYDPHDDPIAAEADAEAAYHASMEDEVAYHMAEDLAAIEAEVKYYNTVIWPKVEPIRDAATKTSTKIATAKAKADLAKAKAKISLAEVTLVEVAVNAELDKNAFLRSAAVTITKGALNKVHTALTETDAAMIEADAAIAEAKADLAEAKEKAKATEEFLVKTGESWILAEFLYNIEEPEVNLTKAKITAVKAQITAAKTNGISRFGLAESFNLRKNNKNRIIVRT